MDMTIPCKICIKEPICRALAEVNIDNSGQLIIVNGLAKQCKTLNSFITPKSIKIKPHTDNPKIKLIISDTNKLNEVLQFYKLDTIPIPKRT